MHRYNKSDNFYLTIFSYLVSLVLGWHIFSFINIYFQLNENKIQSSYEQWFNIQTVYFPIIGIILLIVSVVLLKRKAFSQKLYPLNYKALNWMLIWISILFFSVLVNYILYIFHNSQNIIELINFVFSILGLNQLSKLFYIKEKLTWFHPTTVSTFFISTSLLGISQMLIFKTVIYPFKGYAYIILILMILELVRIFSRFKYLTNYSYETNMIARSLLGKHGIYFGVRVVAGIFMPIVYIIYALYANEKLFQGVGALIIIGEFIERLLFVYLSESGVKNSTI